MLLARRSGEENPMGLRCFPTFLKEFVTRLMDSARDEFDGVDGESLQVMGLISKSTTDLN